MEIDAGRQRPPVDPEADARISEIIRAVYRRLPLALARRLRYSRETRDVTDRYACRGLKAAGVGSGKVLPAHQAQ